MEKKKWKNIRANFKPQLLVYGHCLVFYVAFQFSILNSLFHTINNIYTLRVYIVK